MGSIGWSLLKALGWQIPGVEVRETDRLIRFPGGGSVQVRSADDPNSLRGEGLDFVVLDECAFMAESAWLEALRPALSDRKGRALFISTPRGRNFFWRLSISSDPDTVAFSFPTSTNPHIDPAEIAHAKRTLPERIFLQEFEAQFLDDAGAVFRRVREAATATERHEAEPGKSYVFGVDWARYNDFTVITVIDQDANEMVHMDRFNQIGYSLQLGRLESLYDRFRPTRIIAETNSMGGPLVEELQAKGWPVEGFTTTNASKGAAIEALTLAFENGELQILPDDVLLGELMAFEMDRLPSGVFRYSAPAGLHDDCVMSLAIAWSGVRRRPRWLLSSWD